jgi:hypothetical protein
MYACSKASDLKSIEGRGEIGMKISRIDPYRVRIETERGSFDVVYSAAPSGHPGGEPFVELPPGSALTKAEAEQIMREQLRDGRKLKGPPLS